VDLTISSLLISIDLVLSAASLLQNPTNSAVRAVTQTPVLQSLLRGVTSHAMETQDLLFSALGISRAWILERWLELEPEHDRERFYKEKIRKNDKARCLALNIGTLLRLHRDSASFPQLSSALRSSPRFLLETLGQFSHMSCTELISARQLFKNVARAVHDKMFKGVTKSKLSHSDLFKLKVVSLMYSS